MSIDFQARIDQSFRPGSLQNQAASEALGAVLTKNQNLDPAKVDAWLGYMEGHGGVVSALPAGSILKAFLQLPARPQTFDEPPMKANMPGAMMRRATSTEKPWTDRIDDRDVPARVAAFEADLRWLSALDLGDHKQYQAFASWAGWTKPIAEGETTSFPNNGTVTGWLGNSLARRHGLTKAQHQVVLSIFKGPESERAAKVEKFIDDTSSSVGKVAQRTAVFDAFFMAMGHTRERILDGGTTMEEQQALLETMLGLKAGSIKDRDFEDLLEHAKPGYGSRESNDANLEHARQYGSTLAFEREYVREKPALELLKMDPTFGVLPDRVLRELIATGKPRTAYDVQALFKAGDPATCAILLLDGSATVTKTYDGPVIATLGPGSIAGARFLAGEKTRGAWIHPDVTMNVLELPGPFEELRRLYPKFDDQITVLRLVRTAQVARAES